MSESMPAATSPRPERGVSAPPSDREARIAAALFVPVALALCAVAIFAGRLPGIPAATAAEFGWKRGALLALGVALLGLLALVAARPRIVSRPEGWARVCRYLGYLALALLGLLGFVLAWTRLAGLDESLAHDAAFTALFYVDGGPGAILLGEEGFDVNNHVAYNLLTWLTVSVLGESEAAYRLWSVVPGIAAVAVGAWWAWRRLGAIVAVAFAALAVVAPIHMEYVVDARGYGLAALAATLMLIAADRLAQGYSGRRLLGLLGAGLLGIWTLFIFAIAFVGQALSLLRWPALRRPMLAVLAAAGLLSLAFYAPVIRELAGARALGEPIPIAEALTLQRAVELLVVPSFVVVGRVELAGWMTLAALALVAAGLVALWRRGESGLALILVLPPLAFNVAFGVAGLETVSRHQLFLLTHLTMLVAVAIAELGLLISRYRPLAPLALAAGVVAVLAFTQAIVERSVDMTTPPENFKEAADVVRWSGLGPAITDSPRVSGLRYYLGDDLVELRPEAVEDRLCDPGREVVYIRHVPFPPMPGGVWTPAPLDCLVGREAVRVRVPQRTRGGAIDVWIVDPRPPRRAAP